MKQLRMFACIFVCASMSFLCGCLNIYTRCPMTSAEIKQTYQSTRFAFPLSVAVMFPQVMFPYGGRIEFMWENLYTIPAGAVMLCDTACESVVDTVLWPADLWISTYRERKSEEGFYGDK